MTITHPSDTLIHSSSLLSLLRGDYLPLSLWHFGSAIRPVENGLFLFGANGVLGNPSHLHFPPPFVELRLLRLLPHILALIWFISPWKKRKERETRWIGCTGWVPLFVLSSAPFSRFQLVQRIDIFIGSINGYSRFLFSFPLGPGFFSLFLPTTGRRRLILTRNLRDRLVVNRIDHFLYIFFPFFDWLMIFLHVLMFSLLFLCDLQGFEPQPVDCCRQAHPPRTQLATQFVSQFFCIPILR